MKDISLVKLKEMVEWCLDHKTVTQDLEHRGICLEELEEELCNELNLELIGGSYQVFDKVSVSHSGSDVHAVVIGKSIHEKTPEPWGTWVQNSRGCDLGHYFTEKENAINDFKERSARLIGIDSKSIEHAEEKEQGTKEFRIINGGKFAEIATRENSQSDWELMCFCGNLNNSKSPSITISILETIDDLNKRGYLLADVVEHTKEKNNEIDAEKTDLEMEM